MSNEVNDLSYASILSVARGTYQRDLLAGSARWSGSDLKGKARQWSGRYHASRRNLLTRLDSGTPWTWDTAIHPDTRRRELRVDVGGTVLWWFEIPGAGLPDLTDDPHDVYLRDQHAARIAQERIAQE